VEVTSRKIGARSYKCKQHNVSIDFFSHASIGVPTRLVNFDIEIDDRRYEFELEKEDVDYFLVMFKNLKVEFDGN